MGQAKSPTRCPSAPTFWGGRFWRVAIARPISIHEGPKRRRQASNRFRQVFANRPLFSPRFCKDSFGGFERFQRFASPASPKRFSPNLRPFGAHAATFGEGRIRTSARNAVFQNIIAFDFREYRRGAFFGRATPLPCLRAGSSPPRRNANRLTNYQATSRPGLHSGDSMTKASGRFALGSGSGVGRRYDGRPYQRAASPWLIEIAASAARGLRRCAIRVRRPLAGRGPAIYAAGFIVSRTAGRRRTAGATIGNPEAAVCLCVIAGIRISRNRGCQKGKRQTKRTIFTDRSHSNLHCFAC